MEVASTNNPEDLNQEKYFEVIESLGSFNNYISLLLDDKPNTQQIVFKSSLVIEFYNLKEEIVKFSNKDSSSDEVAQLSKGDKITLPTILETKFSQYSKDIDEVELVSLFYQANNYVKSHRIDSAVKFCEHPVIDLLLNLKIHLLKENVREYINMGLKTNKDLISDKSKLVNRIVSPIK